MASEASGAAGSITGGVGAIMQGQAQSTALDRAAEIQRNNASQDIAAGNVNAGREMTVAGQKIGQTTAAYGAAGVTSDSGSVLNVLAQSASNAELDRQNILHGAQVRATNYNNQATMDEIGAKSALSGSYLNAISSLAMGGSKVFGQSAGVTNPYSPGTSGEDEYSDKDAANDVAAEDTGSTAAESDGAADVFL